MDQTASAAPPGNQAVWAGRVLSALALVFFAMDGAMKLANLPIVAQSSLELGWPADAATIRTLGALLLGSALLYALPRTSVLGAILLTGYLGGAVATHARIGSPLFTHTLFGVYLGVIVWAGVWLRNPRLRALLPLAR